MASSNLLVDKVKSIVAFKMIELVTISRDGFPYRRRSIFFFCNRKILIMGNFKGIHYVEIFELMFC